MRKAFYAFLACATLATGYIASPFVAAWSIREAIQSGNSDYLANKIEWDSVRLTLRDSMSRVALGQPEASAAAETNGAPAATNGAADAPKPGLWQRIKNGISQRAVDQLVENYVTPEGLPQLFTYRKFYREHVTGEAAAVRAMPWHQRVASFWSRIKRAEFKSPAVFEIEMADRNDPSRRYIGLLQLRGLEWKLTELRLRMVTEEAALPALATGAHALSSS